MRIAMIGQKGIPAKFGGVERHVEELAWKLVANNHDVTVYTRPHYTRKSLRSYRGIHTVSLPSLRTKHLDAISHSFIATISAVRKQFDVIHYHGVGPALLSFLPRLLGSHARVIVTFHCIDRKHGKWGPFAKFMLWLGERAAVHFPDETIVVSRSLQSYCKKKLGVDVHYIPSGVSASLQPTRNATLLKQKFGLLPQDYILAVARLIPHKGLHHLVTAFKKVQTKKRLVIVGDSFFTDDYAAELKKLAADDPRVLFTGFQEGATLSALYANAYLFVLPSESEGLPISLLEAASFGIGILASNISENLEVLRYGRTLLGYTFKVANVTDLARMLRITLRHPAQVQRFGRQAQRLVRRNYNWKDIALQTEAVYAPA